MRHPILVALMIALASLAIFGFIQPEQDDPLPEDYDWHAYIGEGESTLAMDQRCREANESLGERMEEVLSLLYEELDDEGDALLRQNQDDWQTYAQSKRDLAGDQYRGGSFSRIVAGQSYVAELIRRIKELSWTLQDRKQNF